MEAIDQFIDQMIEDKKLPGVTDEVKAELKVDLEQRLLDQIDRAMIDALPEDKAEELAGKLDDENFSDEDASKFMQESGVNMQQVALETMLRFRALYLGAEG